MPRPIPFPLTIELIGLAVVSLLLGAYLLVRGTLPRWMPSGFVDRAGDRAVFSRPVYRFLGVTSILAGIACPLVAANQRDSILVAFALIALALLCAIPTAVMALSEQHRRSLRRKRSTYVWSALAWILLIAVNGLVVYGARP